MESENELKKIVEKAAKASLLLNAVMNDSMDKYEEPCVVIKAKYEGFQRVIELLNVLKQKGKCNFEALDLTEQYERHYIYIHWNATDDCYLYIDEDNKSEIKEILDYIDTIVVSDDDALEWQLAFQIYVPVSEMES